MKISEILWLAANEHLADNRDSEGNKAMCSCIAIMAVKSNGTCVDDAVKWYESLADCRVGSFDTYAQYLLGSYLDVVNYNQEERQQIRYCWLMLASQIAEEEGL